MATPRKANPQKAGRRSGYKPEYAEQARKLCDLGATDIELADFFKVSRATIYRWQASYPEFCDTLKMGKASADNRVERSLFSRATGYEVDETDLRVVEGKIVKTKVRKFYPPDTTAAIFWLKNRRAVDWREKSEHVVRLEPAHQMSDDELTRIASGGGTGAIEQKASTSKLN